MKQDARYNLVLESIAEINARLRILDEASARFEAAVERQLELFETLVIRQEQLLTLLQAQMADVASAGCPGRRTQVTQQNPTGNGSRQGGGSWMVSAQTNRIIDHDHEFSRETHPALFKVVDLLEQDEWSRQLSVRQLAHETGVRKSWCAIAKRHVLREESVH